MREPGVCELTSEPDYDALGFALGSMTKREDETMSAIAAVLAKMGRTSVERNLMGTRWSKLLVNAAFSGLSTCFGCTFGDVAKNMRSRLAAQRIIKETIEVARRSGVTIEPIQGKDVVALLDYSGWLKQKIGLLIIPLAIRKHRLIRASMLQDIEKGKRTEIDAINGAVATQGDAIGFDTPLNDLVVSIVKEIERGEAKPGWENLVRFEPLVRRKA
jgi:2-dehydropantoate 2-reductase